MSISTARVPHDWSAGRRSAGAPSARSLLFTILGEFVLPSGGEVWAGSAVRGLRSLGVEEKAARQAIARTAADGWLTGERVGRRTLWRLTGACTDLLSAGAERIYSFGESQENWDGRWVLLFVDEANGERHHLRTRLAWAGFGPLRSGAWIAAHTEREAEARNALAGTNAVSFVATSGEIGDPSEVIAQAWDLDALEDRYEEFVATFECAHPETDEDAFVSLTRLVHAWRKFPFLDPGLPRRLLPRRWTGDRAQGLFEDSRREWGPGARRWFAHT